MQTRLKTLTFLKQNMKEEVLTDIGIEYQNGWNRALYVADNYYQNVIEENNRLKNELKELRK